MAETGNGDQRQPPSFGPPAEAQKEQALNCPRCDSTNTKFCYYINYNQTLLSSKGKRARYFCKTCRRYWTKGGSLRNIPVDGDGQHQPPSFDPPAEARLRDSSSGRDTLVGLNSSNSAMVEPGDGRQCQPPLFDLTDSNYGTGDFWRGCFNSPYTATTEPIDWQFLASPFEPPAAAHLPDRNSGGDFWMGCFNSPYTATTEPIDWQRLASPFEPPAAAHLPDSNSGGDFWMGCFNSPNTAITELIDWQCLTSPFEPPAAAHLPDSNSGRGILTGHFPMAEPRDGQQRQAPPFEPPATAHLPVRNSGNGIWIDAQQRQAPLFEPPDLSCRLPAAFARRRFGFTSNIRSRPVGGKKGERTEEEKKEAHRMACRRSRRKIKAQNELMRDQYQKQIEMLRSYELVNKYKHTAELFASQNPEQNLQADTVNSTDLTASGPGTENLEVGNQINELVNQIDRINATVRRRELVLERLRNVATKRQQLAQFPGEMQNILGTVGGSISRLAEEGETMNVEDLERQIQVEDSFRQRLQEMRNKYFDHDKDSSHTSMFSFEHFQDFIEKSRVDFLEFEGLAEEFETSWKFNLPVPSFLPTHENQLKDYGHITDEDGCQSTLLITDSYILLCSVIKQMNQLQLEQLNLSIIILWRDAINSGLDRSFDEHLRKIANAYFRFYFKRKE